ncbi:MAG: hypothetical protein EXR35_06385 [Limnohabitans sp.]|nr:hypothetical protein [Limnohabitans sp.]
MISASRSSIIRVNIFNTSSNLPLIAAIKNRFFEQRQLNVEVQHTPNSDEQRNGLATGLFEIAHAAVDNAVAMVESDAQDVVIVCGGDAGMNDLMVRSEIKSISDLRGKLLAVDAPNTAYALVAKKILKNHGLIENRDYHVKLAGGTGPRSAAMLANPKLAAGMINPPFSFMMLEKGLKSLGAQFDLLGPYQATGAFVLRSWAFKHSDILQNYLAAYIEGHRYVMNPVNRASTMALIQDKFKLSPAVVDGTYAALMKEGSGLVTDAQFNLPGFKTVLDIRAEMEGMWVGVAQSPDIYLDLSYYAKALAMANQTHRA